MVPLNHLLESCMIFSRVNKIKTVKQKPCLMASQLLLKKRNEALHGVHRKMRARKKLRSAAES